MKKIVLLVASFSVFIFSSCTQVDSTSNKTITQGNDTISDVQISLSNADKNETISKQVTEQIPELLFKAHGSEPGWFIEIYNNKMRMLLDYGKDSLLITDSFINLNNEKGFNYSKEVTYLEKTYNVTLTIKNIACISEASGDKEERTVQISVNNKKYKGCGSFVK